jgi:predicted nucleic acid-binding protein
MSDTPYFVDGSVLLHAIGADHPLKASCVEVLRAIGRGEISATSDAEVLREILHWCASLGQRSRAVELVRESIAALSTVSAVTPADVQEAAALVEQSPSLPARQAVHVAVMRRHGIERIISTDRRFDEVRGVTRVDPSSRRS